MAHLATQRVEKEKEAAVKQAAYDERQAAKKSKKAGAGGPAIVLPKPNG